MAGPWQGSQTQNEREEAEAIEDPGTGLILNAQVQVVRPRALGQWPLLIA